jgi:hypothetical protein
VIAVLLLTIATHQTSQEINAWSLDYGIQEFNFTDVSDVTTVCRGVTQFSFDAETSPVVAVTASACEPDEIFESGFEG